MNQIIVLIFPIIFALTGMCTPSAIEDDFIVTVEYELVERVWFWTDISTGEEYQTIEWVWVIVEKNSTLVEFYDPNTGEISCWDVCWHEVGHKLDAEVMEDVSGSDKFHNEVVNFLALELMYHKRPSHPMALKILLFAGFFVDYWTVPDGYGEYSGMKWGGYSELYADILYWAEGDINKIPENLRQFYDIETATQMYLDL